MILNELPIGSGAVALAHLDGNGTDEAVTAMVTLNEIHVSTMFLIKISPCYTGFSC